MTKTDRHEGQIYQLRVVLRGISPLIWRRLLVRGDSTAAHLHEVLQIAFGWDDVHLNRFEIRGYAVYRDGGGMMGINATQIRLCELKLRRLERFVYEYDLATAGFTICASRLHCSSTHARSIRSALLESARHHRRTAADPMHSWPIASTTLGSVVGNRLRISRNWWTSSMMRS
jgi:hypothetical protein